MAGSMGATEESGGDREEEDKGSLVERELRFKPWP